MIHGLEPLPQPDLPSVGVSAGASFDKTRLYRYHLWREWDPGRTDLAFIMLNPSTADEVRVDPTVAKCIRYAKAWGYGRLDVYNLFALRATDPKQLRTSLIDPVGPENDRYLSEAAAKATCVVVAWGTHGNYRDRGHEVACLLGKVRGERPVLCLGVTQDGQPRHPLYLKDSLTAIIWRYSGD